MARLLLSEVRQLLPERASAFLSVDGPGFETVRDWLGSMAVGPGRWRLGKLDPFLL